MSALRFDNLETVHAPQCAALERLAFPHAAAADLIPEEGFRAYAATFPEGFFVCLDGERIVGQAAGIRLSFDFAHPQHTLVEITGRFQCEKHDPAGDWYYGTDVVVHPDYRRRGIGGRLYALRKDLVRHLGLRGIVAGAQIPGYAHYRHQLSAREYIDQVVARDLYDPTLSFQLENGFEVRAVLEGYIHDDATGGWSALIVWEDPDHPAARRRGGSPVRAMRPGRSTI